MTAAPSTERFEALVAAVGPRLLGYLARRVEQPADAADVLADVFLVAWRRAPEIPPGDEEALRWLYGVARRALANSRRGRRRRHALAERLAAELATVPPVVGDATTLHVRAALRRLGEPDRELLTLIAWEGLSPAEAAAVIGIRPAAARKRLERARDRFAAELEKGGGSPQDAARDRADPEPA